VLPPDDREQSVPAQQAPLLGSQASPALVQTATEVTGSLSKQIIAPGGPAQTPAQQSSIAEHGAPIGAQLFRQPNVPVESAMQ